MICNSISCRVGRLVLWHYPTHRRQRNNRRLADRILSSPTDHYLSSGMRIELFDIRRPYAHRQPPSLLPDLILEHVTLAILIPVAVAAAAAVIIGLMLAGKGAAPTYVPACVAQP